MAFGVSFGPPLNTNAAFAPAYGYGYSQLQAQQQQQMGDVNSGSGESVALSGRARLEATYDRTGQAWNDLRIPVTTPDDVHHGLENLTFLRSIGNREGGGLKLHDDANEAGITASKANTALHNGQPVLFYESGAEEPVSISSFGQLTAVTQDLKQRIAETQQAAQQQQR